MFKITKLDTPPITESRTVTFGRGKKATTETLETTYHEFSVTYGGETRVIRATKGWTDDSDGSVRWFLAHQFRAELASGNKTHRVGLTIDITPDGKVTEYNCVVLNRQARISGFWQAAYDAPEGYGSKHNGTFSR